MSAAERDEAIERGKAKADATAEERQATGTKPKKDKKDKKGSKGKDAKKSKKGGASGASVAAHPRGRQAVRRAKGLGGVLGFALAALLSHRAGLAPDRVVERALIAGVVGYLLAWACAVTVWRHVVLAELRAAAESHRAAAAANARPTIGHATGDATAETAVTADATATPPAPELAAPQPAG